MSCDDDGIDKGILIMSVPGCDNHGLLVLPGVICIKEHGAALCKNDEMLP
jgi:hypothetical protein